MLHRQLMATALFVLLTFLFSPDITQAVQQRQSGRASASFSTSAQVGQAGSGIDTSRLSPKNQERWKAIERIVFAEDNRSQPLHPTLRGMWEWLETSGHTIYVELIRTNRTSTNTAGNFSIERYDPKGDHQVGVIRLNLANIELAYVGPSSAHASGFIPFDGLSKEERYVEVLGHEMAHAIDILTSPESAKSVEFTVEQTNEQLLSVHPLRKGDNISQDLKKKLSRRDELLLELEKRAESMEHIVWKELTRSKPFRN